MIKVLSVGGSIVAPNTPDVDFLKQFVNLVKNWLAEDDHRKLILVIGGGGPARIYQQAYNEIVTEQTDLKNENNIHHEADWIGIMATRLNAQLLKAIFDDLCQQDVVYDPTQINVFSGQILIAAGWKPGFSTDKDAVLLADRFGAKTVINLSNIAQVYTDDPKKNKDAKPLEAISWQDFRKMVGNEWIPGKNVPFDPIASQFAEKSKLKVICADGKNIENIKNILNDEPFFGTTIS
ncbi:MAG: UMP kinase [Treponemataceae bacterium]